jgi:hypothetical protein
MSRRLAQFTITPWSASGTSLDLALVTVECDAAASLFNHNGHLGETEMITQASSGHRRVRRCRTRVATVFAVGWGLSAALALTPGAQAQLAVAPNAPGAAVGTSLPAHTIPLNIPGTYTFPPPPAGFNPETASQGASQAYGLPPMAR